MFKKIIFIFVVLTTLLSACVIPGARRERAAIELQANDSLFMVNEGDFQFRIVMPKDIMIANEPVIELGKNNQLNIRCGNDFNIVASLGPSELSDVMTAQKKDQLFSYQVLDNEDHAVVFKRVLPDGSTYDYRLMQSFQIGEKAYTFHTAPDSEFDLSSVLRMKTALASVQF